MYHNYEDEWQDIRKAGLNFEHPYLPLSLPREVSSLYSDLAFGNPINATVKNNKEADNAIDDLIEDNELNVQLSEASLSQSYKGGIVGKVYLDKGQSRITFIEPDYYFPEVSPQDKRKIMSETIAIPFNQGKNKYLHTEKYEQKEDGYFWCVTQVFNYKDEKLGKEVSDPSEVNTKLTQSPLTYIPFVRSGTNFWGDSLYTGLTPLFDEMNHRTTEISNILDMHSSPAMWAMSSLFNEDGSLNRRGDKVYEVLEDGEGSSKGAPVGYITWDAKLEANFKFIEDVVFKTLHFVSPLAPALYGMDKASQASGRATLLKSWRTQCKVSRSHLYWQSALKKMLYIAQQLQVISGEKSYVPAIPLIELKMNLPHDVLEQVQAEQLKVQSGVTSVKSSIARINPHMTSKEVEEEYQEILEEQNQSNQQTFMNDMLGFNDTTNTTQDEDIDDADTE